MRDFNNMNHFVIDDDEEDISQAQDSARDVSGNQTTSGLDVKGVGGTVEARKSEIIQTREIVFDIED